MKRLLAHWNRHWHCLFGMFDGHREVDGFAKNRLNLIACDCGQIFWTRDTPKQV